MDRAPVRDFVVGLFVLAGIAAIGYLAISIGGFKLHHAAGMKLSANFDETGGLAVGAPVVIGGVRVGEIANISLQDDFRSRIDLDLDQPLKLPTDTSAAIVTAGVLGDRYIELSPGGDDQMLKSGDKISYTESAVILEQLVKQFIYGSVKKTAAESNSATTQPTKTP